MEVEADSEYVRKCMMWLLLYDIISGDREGSCLEQTIDITREL